MEEQNKKRQKLMEELSAEVNGCRRCELWKTRHRPLVGDGPADAEILFVGESPGYHEDLQGRAFVGEAGKVLDILLKSINLNRSSIYITNVLKCHPPQDHNPTRQQIDSCKSHLRKQIEILRPKVIVTLGKFASREVFDMFNLEFTWISQLHGRILEAETDYGKTKIIPLFHPAVACYHTEKLSTLEQDFMKVEEAAR